MGPSMSRGGERPLKTLSTTDHRTVTIVQVLIGLRYSLMFSIQYAFFCCPSRAQLPSPQRANRFLTESDFLVTGCLNGRQHLLKWWANTLHVGDLMFQLSQFEPARPRSLFPACSGFTSSPTMTVRSATFYWLHALYVKLVRVITEPGKSWWLTIMGDW